jgi:hypothetical protein
MMAFMDLKDVLKKSTEKKGKEKTLETPKPEEGFQEPKRKQRSSTETGRNRPRSKAQIITKTQG